MGELLQGGGIWFVTVGLFLTGLVGCVVPVLPGHLLIFVGAIAYRLMKGTDADIAWWGFMILAVLMIISQVFEIVSGSLGAKWFGGSKWGAIGALAGGIVGLFFFPIGLLVGPLAGAFGFEILFAKKKTKESVVSGVGSVIGTIAGMGFKIAVGALMVTWFFLDILVIG